MVQLEKEIIQLKNIQENQINPITKVINAENIIISNLFRYRDYPYLVGYQDVLSITQQAREVWTISKELYWERNDELYFNIIFKNIIEGKRKQLVILPKNQSTNIEILKRNVKDRFDIEIEVLENNFRVTFVDDTCYYKFFINEINIYNPLDPFNRLGILLQPMEDYPKHEDNDENFKKAILEDDSELLRKSKLKEKTYDILLKPKVVENLVKAFIDVWNKNCQKESWKIKINLTGH